jgi:hypothetical protein
VVWVNKTGQFVLGTRLVSPASSATNGRLSLPRKDASTYCTPLHSVAATIEYHLPEVQSCFRDLVQYASDGFCFNASPIYLNNVSTTR